MSSAPPGRAERYAQGRLLRADLEPFEARVLKQAQGDDEARVVCVELPEGRVVLKEWHVVSSRLLRWWARRMLARETRHYRLLAGLPGIPRLLGELQDGALVLEHVDGIHVHRHVPPAQLRAGLDSLQGVLDGLAGRRFAHLDLHQRRNVLVDGRGQAWLVDLGQGLDCRRFPLRLLFPLLHGIDRRAVLKFRARYAPDTLPPDRRDELRARHGRRRKRPGAQLLRRIARRLFAHG